MTKINFLLGVMTILSNAFSAPNELPQAFGEGLLRALPKTVQRLGYGTCALPPKTNVLDGNEWITVRFDCPEKRYLSISLSRDVFLKRWYVSDFSFNYELNMDAQIYGSKANELLEAFAEDARTHFSLRCAPWQSSGNEFIQECQSSEPNAPLKKWELVKLKPEQTQKTSKDASRIGLAVTLRIP